jgi:hypothetical protein
MRNEGEKTASHLGYPHITSLLPPEQVLDELGLDLREDAGGKSALLSFVDRLLRLSVNTWHQGFMDKLPATTNAVGVASELILAVLNTNVSPRDT